MVGVLLLGCASVETVREAPESKGEERLYSISYERMVRVVETTLPTLDLENIDKQSVEPQKMVFLGTHGVTWLSWGEIVRVIVSGVDAEKTSVRVHWRRKFRDGLIALDPDWKDAVFAAIEEHLSDHSQLDQ